MATVEYLYVDGEVITIETEINSVEDTKAVIAKAPDLHTAIWHSVCISNDDGDSWSQHLNLGGIR
jgi:hypothetical protein